MATLNFQRGSSGRGKTKSLTFKVSDSEGHTRATNVRCDAGKKPKGAAQVCKVAEELERKARAIMADYSTDEQLSASEHSSHTSKRKRKKPGVPF